MLPGLTTLSKFRVTVPPRNPERGCISVEMVISVPSAIVAVPDGLAETVLDLLPPPPPPLPSELLDDLAMEATASTTSPLPNPPPAPPPQVPKSLASEYGPSTLVVSPVNVFPSKSVEIVISFHVPSSE